MEYETSVHIAAPPELLWRLTVDIEGWPRLTSTMTSVRRLDEGPLRVGGEALVKQPGLRAARWRVTELADGGRFVWQSTAGGVTSVGEHLVVPDGDGTRLTLAVRQSGVLAGLVGALYGRRIRRFVDIEAAGFRAAAEAEVASGG
jgi:uncharacterized membrane protein